MFARVAAPSSLPSSPTRMFKNDLFEEAPALGDVLARAPATSEPPGPHDRVSTPALLPTTSGPVDKWEAQRLKAQQARRQRIQGQSIKLTVSPDETLARAASAAQSAFSVATHEHASPSAAAPTPVLRGADDSDDDDLEVMVLEATPPSRPSSRSAAPARGAQSRPLGALMAAPEAAGSDEERGHGGEGSAESTPHASAQTPCMAMELPGSRPDSPREDAQEGSSGEVAKDSELISVPNGPRANHALEADTLPAHDRLLQSVMADRKVFTMLPGPLVAPTQCYIVREKGTGGMLSKTSTQYKLYMEGSNEFLLAACRRKRTATASYIISLDPDDLNRNSESYFGKTKSNFLGTEFWIYDNKERPGRARPVQRTRSLLSARSSSSQASPSSLSSTSKPPGDDQESGDDEDAGRTELGVVAYQMNVMGTNGPRKMCVGIPAVDLDTQTPAVWRPAKPSESMMAHLKDPSENMIFLENKAPKWNAALGAYCLNFGGRVTQASVKNFQLVASGDSDREVLQFGRVGKNTFSMDYRWPISAFQALCICITSLDNKLACE